VTFRSFLTASRVRFIVGKGGVGKTTVSAALALAGAAEGLHVHVIELEGREEFLRCFDAEGPLQYESTTLYEHPSGGRVSARHLGPDEALVEWLRDHGFGRLVGRLRSSGALDVIATAVPGIRDVLVLGKIKALARDFDADAILVDAPATGHSLSLLASPSSLMAAARSGPIRRQAEEVDQMLRDETRCCVSLVTLAAELPVTEAVEAAFGLEDRAGVALSSIIVNQFAGGESLLRTNLAASEVATLDPHLAHSIDVARWFTLARVDEEARQLSRLHHELPLEQMVLPRLEADTIDLSRLSSLADACIRAAS